MIDLENGIRERGHDREQCRIDGCNYGMMDLHNTGFIQKKWGIKTNDLLFWKNFRAKCCPRNHQHVHIEGAETARSAYYPKRMVESIVRHWKHRMAPLRHIQLLSNDNDEDMLDEDENWIRRTHPPQVSGNLHPLQECLPVDHPEALLSADFPEARLPDDSVLAGVSQQERDAWNAKINHYHRAAGHPTGRNLVRLFRDAGLLQWKIRMAMDFKCPACESLKRGGSSSGNLPPAATHPLPAA